MGDPPVNKRRKWLVVNHQLWASYIPWYTQPVIGLSEISSLEINCQQLHSLLSEGRSLQNSPITSSNLQTLPYPGNLAFGGTDQISNQTSSFPFFLPVRLYYGLHPRKIASKQSDQNLKEQVHHGSTTLHLKK